MLPRLMPIGEFRELCFVGNKAPTLATLKKWPEVVKRGGSYFIDLNKFESSAPNDGLSDDERAKVAEIEELLL